MDSIDQVLTNISYIEFALATLAWTFASFVIGYWIRRLMRPAPTDLTGSAESTIATGALALLAFMLAFSFSLSAARYDVRRKLVIKDTNAISTAYLRASFLAEPDRGAVQALLRNYVDVQIQGRTREDIEEILTKSKEVHLKLWAIAADNGRKFPSSVVIALFIDAANEVINVHEERVTFGLRFRNPKLLWVVIYTIAGLAMFTIGYHSGTGKSFSLLPNLAMAIMLTSVVTLNFMLDRPHKPGGFSVNLEPLVSMRDSMATSQK